MTGDEAPVMGQYEARVQAQIQQYIDEPIHDLPGIFHIWSHNHILPGLKEVFGAESVNDFYFKAAEEATNGFASHCRILSVGCGDGDVEIALASSLLAVGVSRFKLEAVDISPVLIERFQEKLASLGLEEFVFPSVIDINNSEIPDDYNVIMANHSLHHMLELEQTFEKIYSSLSDGGIFATSDMIGRNGHMRWPETEAMLKVIWPLLSDRQKFHHQLLKHDAETFVDHDCSTEGFEGIRAQDILYLILNRFHPYRFLGLGGFIDVLVDRGYGPGFDQNSDWDRSFISALAKINDMMVDGGMIKPTQMMAYFTKHERESIFFRSRTAQAAVRMPYDNPAWTKAYL